MRKSTDIDLVSRHHVTSVRKAVALKPTEIRGSLMDLVCGRTSQYYMISKTLMNLPRPNNTPTTHNLQQGCIAQRLRPAALSPMSAPYNLEYQTSAH